MVILGCGKRLVSKYGSPASYRVVRLFFIGLIVGEILCYILGGLLSMWLDIPIAVELHRR